MPFVTHQAEEHDTAGLSQPRIAEPDSAANAKLSHIARPAWPALVPRARSLVPDPNADTISTSTQITPQERNPRHTERRVMDRRWRVCLSSSSQGIWTARVADVMKMPQEDLHEQRRVLQSKKKRGSQPPPPCPPPGVPTAPAFRRSTQFEDESDAEHASSTNASDELRHEDVRRVPTSCDTRRASVPSEDASLATLVVSLKRREQWLLSKMKADSDAQGLPPEQSHGDSNIGSTLERT